MKKLLIVGPADGIQHRLAFSQVLKLVNNRPCDVYVEIKAEDIAHLPCTLESNIFVVPAFSTVSFANVPAVDPWPKWLGGAVAVIAGSAWGLRKIRLSRRYRRAWLE